MLCLTLPYFAPYTLTKKRYFTVMDSIETIDGEDKFQVTYKPVWIETIRGARSSLGVPEEPDEDVYQYAFVSCTLMGIEIEVEPSKQYYEDEYDLFDDVERKAVEKVEELMGRRANA
jgi:hypothetical protein